ncbi:MAG: molybdopterin cofactor-binding domain-containing protein, partial [Pseudomonadota bacterium]
MRSNADTPALSRRSLLAGSTASLVLFGCSDDHVIDKVEARAATPPVSHKMGVYISIRDDNRITFATPNAEMGQGTFDGLARMLADELDADWEQIDIALSGYNPAMFNPRIYGQTTGNSFAIRGFGPAVRKAGAAARLMLRQAAAMQLGIPLDKVVMSAGTARANGTTLRYGDLAAQAAQLDVPKDVPLKSSAQFKLIGKPFKRKETRPKTTGEARFGIDVELPGQLVAALAMPREAWGDVTSEKGVEQLRQRDDIVAVTPVTGGYAVIAEDFWTAKSAADTLEIEVDLGDEQRLSSADLDNSVKTAATSDSAEAALYKPVSAGQDLPASRAAFNAALTDCDRQAEFLYSVPVWAHGALEPLTATAWLEEGKLRLWAPHQNPKAATGAAAKAAGVPVEAVTLERTFLGGSFGRKWNTDFVVQAAEAAKAVPGRPVKLIWTREQDTQHDFYRPQLYGVLKFGCDQDGQIKAASNIVAGQSVARTWFGRYNPDAPDNSLQNQFAYDIQNGHIESRAVELPLPMGWWRSVSHMPTVFFQECAMDELALKAGQDPFAYRLAHLSDPRGQRVLEQLRTIVANEERAIGIAYSDSYEGYLAAAISVSISDGQLHLHDVWVVADVGMMVDPETVQRQISGGLYFGLGP